MQERFARHPYASGCLVAACTLGCLLGAWLVQRGWGVRRAEKTTVYRDAAHGGVRVRWTTASGSHHEDTMDPKHADAIFGLPPEHAWYHPGTPGRLRYYGKVWPVPYMGAILLALAVPVLCAHLGALAKR